MKAICSSKIGINELVLKDIEMPVIKENHVLIKVAACGINHGDIAWINGFIPRGMGPESVHDVAGVSGAGEIIEVGDGVPSILNGCKVAFYRALNPSAEKVGAWSEYVLMHYLDCLQLPDDANSVEYCGSLVNIITPYAFVDYAKLNQEKAVIITAGTSATGIALLGIAQQKGIPVISIVRNESGKKQLQELNAKYILMQSSNHFEEQLQTLSQELNATTVFDGVGGSLITTIAPLLPFGSAIYAYGFLGGKVPVSFETSLLLMKNLTISSFGGFTSEVVTNPDKLNDALNNIKQFVHLPHFKTNIGSKFTLQEYQEALGYSVKSNKNGNAVFVF